LGKGETGRKKRGRKKRKMGTTNFTEGTNGSRGPFFAEASKGLLCKKVSLRSEGRLAERRKGRRS
jgi:hypothetical protein